MARFFRPVFAGVALLTYAVVFAEFFLRFMDPQPLLPRFVTGTELGIRGNIPDATYRHQTAEIDVEMRMNSQGMRADRDYALAPTSGVCRIAILGDSYFMGYESELPDSIAGQIGSQLAEAGFNVEVLNFSVSGFGTAEMLHLFEQRVVDFAPDITVFQFHFSDFGDNVRSRMYQVDENGTLTATGRPFLPGVKMRDRLMAFGAYRWLISNSHLYSAGRELAADAVKDVLTSLRAKKKASGDARQASPGGVPLGQVALSSALLEATRVSTEAAASDWYSMDIPEARGRLRYFTRSDDLNLSQETRKRMALPVHAFDAMKGEDVKLFQERGHWHLSRLGNRVATKVLVDMMLQQSQKTLSACPLN